MFSFKDFLSVYDHLREDIAAMQQQSANYQKQIQDMNTRMQRLLQLKAAVDKQIQTQSQNQAQTNNQASNAATMNATSGTPGAQVAPGMAPTIPSAA